MEMGMLKVKSERQSGFTLIELAIVLVIIGLLLAGVLRGQELINSAKVKNLANDFKNIPVYLYAYQDRFRAIPGDDHAANTHVNGANATSSAQTQNGVIQGAWNSQSTADESYLFWQHVRLAGFAAGSTDVATPASYVQRNAEGGQIGVTSVAALTAVSAGALNGAYAICSDGIIGRFATQLDATLDDGVGNSGSMRIVANGTPSTGVAVPEPATPYLVCMSF
jgi:prepilin-type N-terminal cleavage/methylation domain-containing protein